MEPEYTDVLVVGAGLSGIGATAHLRAECPGRSVVVLESRAASGGTWDLFRYPGVRSDSDMYTLGYRFRPWMGSKALADGPSILEYIRETARELDLERLIRYQRRVVHASWSSEQRRWTVEVEHTDTGERSRMTCGFLYCNTGYYDYERGYQPDFPGREAYAGAFVHPQAWPEGLDVTGKQVVVIGSGATAVTLVPTLAKDAAHVTMLQRSPSWILSLRSKDKLAERLRHRLPATAVYRIVRAKNIALAALIYQLSRRRPRFMREKITEFVAGRLPKGYDVAKHFSPTYEPWDQRLCLVPDGDLFRAIRNGDASMATDRIRTLTEKGILLESGEELPADVIVSATGLNLLLLGGITLDVDGAPVDAPSVLNYKGTMFGGVPNFALTVGYTNASWTLKADLVATWVCRVLNHMDKHGYRVAVPQPPTGPVNTRPIIDLNSGYVHRSAHLLPRQGEQPPWRLHQNYVRDIGILRFQKLDDGVLTFS
jgi:monooxygenase